VNNAPPDKLFHVRVGPYADIKDAEATRAKLVSDGYNPILKK
jgi:cell division protein FtsN